MTDRTRIREQLQTARGEVNLAWSHAHTASNHMRRFIAATRELRTVLTYPDTQAIANTERQLDTARHTLAELSDRLLELRRQQS
jgi:hypothetical protein